MFQLVLRMYAVAMNESKHSKQDREKLIPAYWYYPQSVHLILSLKPESPLQQKPPTYNKNHISGILFYKIIDNQTKVTYDWDGSLAKYSFAFSYDIGWSLSIKSDKSISKVGPRLLNSEPYDTWFGQNMEITQILIKSEAYNKHT